MAEEGLTSIKVHGWLMYTAFGCLMPLGILVVRFMQHARKLYGPKHPLSTSLFYAHQIIQIAAIGVMTGGAIFSFKKFGLAMVHTHQRLGLSLWMLVLVQMFTSLYRPSISGMSARAQWYMLHWSMGTGAVILGIYNLYVGIHVWEIITKESIIVLNIAFSVQIAVMTFIYLLQGRWENLLVQIYGLPKKEEPEERHEISSPIRKV